MTHRNIQSGHIRIMCYRISSQALHHKPSRGGYSFASSFDPDLKKQLEHRGISWNIVEPQQNEVSTATCEYHFSIPKKYSLSGCFHCLHWLTKFCIGTHLMDELYLQWSMMGHGKPHLIPILFSLYIAITTVSNFGGHCRITVEHFGSNVSF